jgi:hypothetical protein
MVAKAAKTIGSTYAYATGYTRKTNSVGMKLALGYVESRDQNAPLPFIPPTRNAARESGHDCC